MVMIYIAGQKSDTMINAIGLRQTPEFVSGIAYKFNDPLEERFAPDDAITESKM